MPQTFYLIRSKTDGQYLVARPRATSADRPDPGYLLLFKEHYEALSYLNQHGAGVAEHFAVEPLASAHLGGLIQRWGFTGLGIVQDPLVPSIEFLKHDPDR